MYYDIDGNPIELMEWAKLFEASGIEDYRRIATTQIGDVWVSTVWLGINHNPWGGAPAIFETMIFPESDYQERYATKHAALAGHDRAVAHVESGDYAAEIRAQEGE